MAQQDTATLALPRTLRQRWETFARDLPQARWVYPFKVALATVLSLYFAFLLNLDHTFWTLLTLPFIVRPDSGSMVWRGSARIAGTILGAMAGFVLSVTFGQYPVPLILSVALFVFLSGYMARMQTGGDAYAYAVAGLTAILVAIEAGPDINQAYGLALARATETVIPIICAFVVLLVVFPRSTSSEALGKLTMARRLAAKIAADAVDGKPTDSGDEAKLVSLLSLLHTDLRSLAYERPRRQWLRPRLTQVAEALHRLVVLAEGAHVAASRVPTNREYVEQSDAQQELAGLIRYFADRPPELREFLAAAAQAEAIAARMEPRSVLPASGPVDIPALTAAHTLYRLRLVARAMRDLMLAEAALFDPTRPTKRAPTVITHRYKDRLAAIQAGLRPAIIFVALSTIWIATAAPNGVIFTLIGTVLTLLMPVVVPRPGRRAAGLALAVGMLSGGAITLALMMTLPFTEGFASFSLIVGATIFAIFYVASRPTDAPLALGSIIIIAIGLQPANEQLYDAAGLFNSIFSLAWTPAILIISVTVIFPEDGGWLRRHLRSALTDLTALAMAREPMSCELFLEQTIDVFGDYGAEMRADDAEGQHQRRRASGTLIVGLQAYEMRDQEKGALPAELARLGPELRDAINKASRAKGDADKSEILAIFDEAEQQLARIGLTGLAEEPRFATIRWGASVSLIRAIIASGQLSRTKGRTDAS